MVEEFYSCFGIIDVHDHLRQGSLAMERERERHKWWHSVFATIYGICLIDSYLAYKFEMEAIHNSPDDVLHDVEMIKKEAGIVGLELNPQKSEVVGNNSELIAGIQSVLPGVRVVAPAVATLLGSPIGGTESLDAAIDTKTAMLKCLRERFRYITCHDAYLLLRHSSAIPKLLYLLRTSLCFLSPSLKIYDDELRATICSSFNIHLTESDSSWIQSILPVNCGGLGIRSAVQLAPWLQLLPPLNLLT